MRKLLILIILIQTCFFDSLLVKEDFKDYMTSRDMKFEVIDKHYSPPAYRVGEKWIMLCKDKESGKLHEIRVTYSTFYSKEVGDDVVFNISRSELSPSDKYDTHLGIYAMVSVISFVISIVLLIFSLTKGEEGEDRDFILGILSIIAIVLILYGWYPLVSTV